jgi:TRAP-type C4-dicarboxylate transport system substrate-binding protein
MWASVMLMAALASPGCAVPANSSLGQKAGGPVPPLSVTLADSAPPGKPTNLAAADFARVVGSLSKGAITVTVRDSASRGGPGDDAPIIADVRDGTFQLAMVPTRAWAENGTGSMRALQLPFEVLSSQHMAAIARADDVTRTALSGLAAEGVHGLSVFPESLRMLMSFGDPFTDVSNFEGSQIATLADDLDPVIRALGAQDAAPDDDRLNALVIDGTVDGIETDLARAAGFVRPLTATANLVLYPKFVSLVANERWWNDLTPEQRATLTEAAVQMSERAAVEQPDVAQSAQRFCTQGGTVVLASDTALKAFRAAAEPFVAGLDTTQVERIRSLAPSPEPAPAAPCSGAASAPDPVVVPDGGELPNGVYRLEWTPKFRRDWTAERGSHMFGNPAPSESLTQTLTWTLLDGRYQFEIVEAGEEPYRDSGVYQVRGDQMLLSLAPDMGGVVNTLQWSVSADGSLGLAQIDDHDPDPAYALPWVRVGDP